MAEPYAIEYTPELSKSYLDSLMTDIDDLGRIDEGRAMSEAAARGLTDQGAFIGSSVGQVRRGVRDAKSRTIGAFNLDVANKKREERLGEKSRGWNVEDRNFAAAEAEKSRAFQKQMAELGYSFDERRQERESEFNAGGFLSGLVTHGASAAIGGYMGRK